MPQRYFAGETCTEPVQNKEYTRRCLVDYVADVGTPKETYEQRWEFLDISKARFGECRGTGNTEEQEQTAFCLALCKHAHADMLRECTTHLADHLIPDVVRLVVAHL
jgi:hypothetical protein